MTNPIFYHWSIIGMCRHSIKPPVEKTISTTWFECFGFGECFACRVWVASKTCALFSSCFSLICSGSLSFFTLLFVFFSCHATNEQVRPIILPPPSDFLDGEKSPHPKQVHSIASRRSHILQPESISWRLDALYTQTINFWVLQGIAPATFEGPNISRNDAASVASRNRGLFVGHKSNRVSETLAQKERQIRLVATS